MKQIYFVLTHTGTVLSQIITFFMHDEFSHISISLDEKLEKMYSFGRIYAYNPFYGGFIHEHVHQGTFKRFYNTKAKIMSFAITEEQFQKLQDQIAWMEQNKRMFKFNTIGLFAIYFNKKITRKNYFYCAEFVKNILEKSGIDIDLPDMIRPEHFKTKKQLKVIYQGLLREYC